MFRIKPASLVLSCLAVGASAVLLATYACRGVREAGPGPEKTKQAPRKNHPKRIFSRNPGRTRYRYIKARSGSHECLELALEESGWDRAQEARRATGPADRVPAASAPAPSTPGPSTPAAGSPAPAAPTTPDPGGILIYRREATTGSDEFFMGATRRVAGSDRVRRIFVSDQMLKRAARWQRGKQRPSFARVYVADGCTLELLRMRVTVTIEGPRARTVVDHVFRNPHDKQLEGTFEYPLPASASPCYYAMFLTPQRDRVPDFFGDGLIGDMPAGVFAAMQPSQAMRKVDTEQWGVLREATVVPRQKARQTYEEITRRQIDPALLEYAAGNTFRGRVFPIQGGGLNRIIVAYEEHLDLADGRVSYRFPLPDCELELLDVTVTVDGRAVTAEELLAGGDNSKVVRRVQRDTGRVVYQRVWGRAGETKKTRGPGGELALAMTPTDGRVQAISGRDPSAPADKRGNARTFYARVRPTLPATVRKPFADRAVFLLDTSFSEEPDRFHANLEILKQILESDTDLRHFNVACFDVRAAWLKPDGWIQNDEQGRKMVLDRLRRVMLEGATDLSSAFDLLKNTRWRPLGTARKSGYLFLMTDGQLNWGDRDTNMLVASLENATLMQPRVFCYRTGISAENLELFEKLTRKGGGVFNVFTEAMARKVGLAHRRPAFLLDKIEVAGAKDVLIAGRRAAVFPGGEIVIAGRYSVGAGSPTEIVLRGRFDGQPKVMRLPLALGSAGTLADRAWAEIAVHQMLALDDPEIEPLAVAYAQRYRLGSRRTSFLVLETDADYRRFEIQKEASQLKVTDMAGFLNGRYDRRPPIPTRMDHWKAFLDQQSLPEGKARELLLKMHEQDLRLPAGSNQARVLTPADGSRKYLKARRSKQRLDSELFIREAQARARKRDEHGCVRALSTLVETRPGRTSSMRLVGYRLLSWHQCGPAARLFDRVRMERPFEPQSYRDLARSLELTFRYPLAALQYEILLAGRWHDRFGGGLPEVTRSDYQRLITAALRSGTLSQDLIDWFEARKVQLGSADQGSPATKDHDLRVTVSWNTDNTDVDLWVVEPDGARCGYNQKQTHNGGRLLEDLTQGYGPERYQVRKALRGEYRVVVHYYRPNQNLVAGETHVEVVVERRPGRKGAETRRFQVVLNKAKQAREVCVVRFPVGGRR